MTFTVVIPAFQSSAHLGRCLDAIARSNLVPLETIVVDDGSTDDTVARAQQAGAVVLHVSGGPRGPAAAAGCGAIRRSVFEAIDGFDERFRRPSIEDIELGGRLRRAGHRVWLCPDIQATHLKSWTFSGIITSDIRDRAIPWSRLIGERRELMCDLNVDVGNRVSAAAAWTGIAALAAVGVASQAVWIAAASVVVLVLLNARLYSLFLRQGGPVLAAVGAGMRALYFLYSSAVFVVVAGGRTLVPAVKDTH